MPYLFLCYPKCTTCQKAQRWLNDRGITLTERHIKEAPPTVQELEDWLAKSGLPLKKFFNTSGLQYKTLRLKEKLSQLSEAEQLAMLAADGMLVKRPILIADNKVLVGFNEREWERVLETS